MIKKIELCGKLGIVKSILEAERNSRLYFNKYNGDKFNPDLGDNVWYTKFLKRLTEGVPRDNFDALFDNIAIVTFNYDRCIEYFLLHALVNYYRIHEDEISSLLNSKLKILHPYGQVGRLPWQIDSGQATDFGASKSGVDLLNVVRR